MVRTAPAEISRRQFLAAGGLTLSGIAITLLSTTRPAAASTGPYAGPKQISRK
jgi:hypothetical protein